MLSLMKFGLAMGSRQAGSPWQFLTVKDADGNPRALSFQDASAVAHPLIYRRTT